MSGKQPKFTVGKYIFATADPFLGWGKTDPCGLATSHKLLEAEVRVVSDADCAAASGLQQCSANPATLSYSGKITSQMLCASATGSPKRLVAVTAKNLQGRMLAKATVVGHSLSRTVTNTIWQAWSVGATVVLLTACRASMLRSPS